MHSRPTDARQSSRSRVGASVQAALYEVEGLVQPGTEVERRGIGCRTAQQGGEVGGAEDEADLVGVGVGAELPGRLAAAHEIGEVDVQGGRAQRLSGADR